MLEKPFLCAIVARAGQPGEIDKQGNFMKRVQGSLRGQVEVEAHLAIGGRGIMGELEEFAAERGDGRFRLDCHYFRLSIEQFRSFSYDLLEGFLRPCD